MTTVLDTKIVPIVVKLIAKYGRTVTVTIETKTKDWGTGLTGTATATHVVKCSPPEPYNQRYIDGDLVRTGDMKTLFAASGLPFTPVLGMRIDEWTAVRVDPILSGDQTAAYQVQLRA